MTAMLVAMALGMLAVKLVTVILNGGRSRSSGPPPDTPETDFPFGQVIDQRDVTSEAEADQVRVEVWQGRTSTEGGTCTTYAAPIERLTDALRWQQANPDQEVNVGVTVRFGDQLILVTLSAQP